PVAACGRGGRARSTLFPYTTLSRSDAGDGGRATRRDADLAGVAGAAVVVDGEGGGDVGAVGVADGLGDGERAAVAGDGVADRDRSGLATGVVRARARGVGRGVPAEA